MAPTELAAGDGDLAVRFVEGLCRTTGDSIAARAGTPLEIRGWQSELLHHLFARRADGKLKHRQALIGLPRKSGKSQLISAASLFQLLCGPDGGEVYAAAGSRDQARIVFGAAKRMVELEPELAESVRLFRDAIEVHGTGSVFRVLSADAPKLEGLNPTAVLFDEVHVQPNRQLWDVLSLASAARTEPMMIGITTAGVRTDSSGNDSLCFTLYEYGKRVASGEVDDPSFFMAWYEPRDLNADHRDPAIWAEVNPGYGDLQDPADFDAACKRTPEAEFRTKRLNMWVSSKAAWLPTGAWARCAEPQRVSDAPRVLVLDGSYNNDCTALLAVSCEEKPHLEVVELWERPASEGLDWQVPIADVEERMRQYCRERQVVEIAADPFRWARSLQALEAEGLPVVEFPQSPARMTPATQRLFDSVVEESITHDGDPRLARHIDNAVLKVDARGSRLAKDRKGSSRRIDLAVCAVMGLDRASFWAGQEMDYDLAASFG